VILRPVASFVGTAKRPPEVALLRLITYCAQVDAQAPYMAGSQHPTPALAVRLCHLLTRWAAGQCGIARQHGTACQRGTACNSPTVPSEHRHGQRRVSAHPPAYAVPAQLSYLPLAPPLPVTMSATPFKKLPQSCLCAFPSCCPQVCRHAGRPSADVPQKPGKRQSWRTG